MLRILPAALAAAFALALASPALAQVPPIAYRTQDGVSVQAVGRVASVIDDRTFTLDARDVTLRVVLGSRFRQGPAVRVGDRVRVFGELVGPAQVEADQMLVLQRGRPVPGVPGAGRGSVTLAGTIRRIDRDSQRFVLATAQGDVRVDWTDETEFIRENVRSGPREFRAGDPVRVIGRRTGADEFRARRVIFGGSPGWTQNAVGEIVGIDSRARELEVDFGGEIWTVRLAGATTLTRNGRRLALGDLRIGQEVRVAGTERGGRVVEATRVEVLRDRDRE